MLKGSFAVEERVAQGRSSFVPATIGVVVCERTVEVELSRGVRAMVEFVSTHIAISKDIVARRRFFQYVGDDVPREVNG